MKRIISCLFGMLLFSVSYADEKNQAADNEAIPDDAATSLIKQHLKEFTKQEYFTAIQVSIKTGDKIMNYPVGRLSHDEKSNDITKDTLFNIGSITKSYTASLMLQAQKEQQLDLEKRLCDYLKNYPNWDNLTLTSLLNMTSGLPNYSNSPKINYLFSQNIKQFWSKADLVNLVYTPNYPVPLKQGYYYTNTGYIFSAMILETLYKKTYSQLLLDKVLTPLSLKNTFFPSPAFSLDVLKRMAQGYNYNVFDNPELVGQNVTDNNLSWAGAAGGIVANSEDVIHWVDALFNNNDFLDEQQRQLLTKIVSTKTGKPIDKTNKDDNRGFGLGVIQAYNKTMGRYWFYEGETLGYRAFYMYSPCNGVIISALFNSAVNGDNDHGGLLLQQLYQQVLTENPDLQCKHNS